MPVHRRFAEQQKARDFPFFGLGGSSDSSAASSPSATASPPTQPSSNNPPPPPPTPSSKPPPKTTPTPTPTPSKSVDTDTAQQQSSTEETKHSSKSEVDTATVSSTKSISSTAPKNTEKVQANTFINTSGLGQPTALSVTPSLTGADSLASSTSTPTPVGGLNTGAIVGGIAGGLVVLAIIGFVISYFIRRSREREREEEFAAEQQNRRSVMTFGGWGGLRESRPLSIFGRRFGGSPAAPSISEGIEGGNMAGRGVNHYQTDAYASTMQQTSGAPASQGLQPRPQYTFGQPVEEPVQVVDSGGDDPMEEADGAYSHQPQMQNVYDLQAYGDYHAYASYPAPASSNTHDTHVTHERGTTPAPEDDPYGGI